jgi:hypothetical protein
MRTTKGGAAILLATTLLVTACASGVRKTVEFSSASPEALLIVGTTSDPPQQYTVTFSTYDAPNLRLSSNSFKGQHTAEHDASLPATVQYHALLVPPGTYVMKSVSIWHPAQTTVICLSQGTAGFELKPGEIIYVGNIALNRGEDVVRTGFDDAAAVAALQEYPNVQGELVRGKLTDVTFRNGKDALGLGEVCGGYYVDELPKS